MLKAILQMFKGCKVADERIKMCSAIKSMREVKGNGKLAPSVVTSLTEAVETEGILLNGSFFSHNILPVSDDARIALAVQLGSW